ncbi:LPS export ABC transporter periplasmic protein LptC [Formosa sp. PL04]|uniref:LPS export ABC transporter periplasmic protein LptC n=1 Tax=Formosa sp. PL04 TaxID=3081755 RepID=UPI0029829978|nr:LPS export ABC transporter periplasmic protein LptC [Formosa sp. PL04]MDW5287936.1 LPS export ABC transporter periplasmic protein LptC [Formosa sp. PL04]
MFLKQYIFFFMVIAFAMTMFISCAKDLKGFEVATNEPIGVAENINLKYTDSGKLKANLISPKMFDYSNRDFSFSEFPDGIILYLYDKDNNKSTVISDYAISYDKTGLIDLQGNVVLATNTYDTLFAQQLYYDQNKQWLSTNQPVQFRTGGDLINGNGFDSDVNFEEAEVLEINGILTLDE